MARLLNHNFNTFHEPEPGIPKSQVTAYSRVLQVRQQVSVLTQEIDGLEQSLAKDWHTVKKHMPCWKSNMATWKPTWDIKPAASKSWKLKETS